MSSELHSGSFAVSSPALSRPSSCDISALPTGSARAHKHIVKLQQAPANTKQLQQGSLAPCQSYPCTVPVGLALINQLHLQNVFIRHFHRTCISSESWLNFRSSKVFRIAYLVVLFHSQAKGILLCPTPVFMCSLY